MMKKAVPVTFALLILLVFVAGCTGMSAEDLVKKAYAASSKAAAYNIDSTAETESEIGVQGQAMSTKSTLATKAAVDRSNRRLFMDVSARSQGGLLGDSESKSEGYIIGDAVFEKDRLGKWYKGTIETDIWKSMENISQMDALLSLIKASDVSSEQTESIGGRENYVVRVSPDVLRLMESYGIKLTGTTAEEIKKAVKEYTVTVWVDKETFLISKAAIRIRMESESSGSYVKIIMKMDMRFYNYNKPANIELPKEAENAVDIGQRVTITRPGQITTSQDSAKKPEVKAETKPDSSSFSAKGEDELCAQKEDCLKELACYKGKCREFAGEGELCEEADSVGGKVYGCKDGLECVWGLCIKMELGAECFSKSFYCDYDKGLICIAGQCSYFSDEGGLCDNSVQCKQGMGCQGGKCALNTYGKGDIGASCGSSSGDCKGYLQCYKGKCRPYGSAGDDCDSDFDCQKVKGGIIKCYKGKCREAGSDGDSCDSLADCKSTLNCDNGICRKFRVGVGEKCLQEQGISAVEKCSGGACIDGLCVPYRKEGESCIKKTSDYYSGCENGLYCSDEEGVCKKLGSIGNWCKWDSHCLTNLKCDAGKSTCSEGENSTGKSCYKKTDCKAGLQCYKGKCRDYGSTGDDCVYEADCKAGLQCHKGACREWGAVGNDCVNYLDCDYGLACYKGACRQPGQAGDECINSNDCRRGLYCTSGRCA